MSKFLIDVNLPYKISLWNNDNFINQFDINDESTDEEIWEFAKENMLTIITKDSDFSMKILMHSPPPKVIHFRIGNMKFKEFYEFVNLNWNKIKIVSESHKLTNVFIDRIEGIE